MSASNGNSATRTIPQTAPAGGVSFTQPPQTASASFYKIGQGQTITFGWNLTSLYETPTAITFKAWCTENGNTYDVGTVGPEATQILWSPYDYEQQGGVLPLAIGTYQLQVYDERGPGAAASPGLFAPNTQVKFALYRPQAYVPLESWKCGPDCGAGGLRAVPSTALVMAVTTVAAILLGGLGVLGRGIRRRTD